MIAIPIQMPTRVGGNTNSPVQHQTQSSRDMPVFRFDIIQPTQIVQPLNSVGTHTCLRPVTLLTRLHIFNAGPSFKFLFENNKKKVKINCPVVGRMRRIHLHVFHHRIKIEQQKCLSVNFLLERKNGNQNGFEKTTTGMCGVNLRVFGRDRHVRPELNLFPECIG